LFDPGLCPILRNQETASAQETALTDDLEIVEGSVEISTPVWKHKDEELAESSPENAAEGDMIVLSAQVKNYPESASVTFDIYDVSGNPRFLIKSIKGPNENGNCKCGMVVEDLTERGRS
jgi:hypothetical protein